MMIRRSDLDGAVREGILSTAQADRLIAFLAGTAAAVAPGGAEPRFSFVHVLYYLGGMIAIGAMSLFMTLGWNALGGWGGFVTAVLYAMLALSLTHWFLERKQLEIPAGITATLAVGVVLLWRYRFPFMLMPIAVTLWYMSMDLVPFLLGQEHVYDWEIRKFISAYFGLAMTLVAFWVDLRSRFSRDYAFWLYLFGVLTFWGGLSLMNSGSELGKLAYCGINVLMILVGAVLGRRVFAVFGGLGVAGYLGHLSYKVFKDSLIFPLALSLLGLAIIGLGVLWQRREAQWSARLRGFLPAPLRELIEARALR